MLTQCKFAEKRGLIVGKSLSRIQLAVLEVLEFQNMLDRKSYNLEAFKRVLFLSNPVDMARKVYPEVFGEEPKSNIDEMSDNELESTEIEYALEAPSAEEAMRVANLLGDQTGRIEL